MPNKVDNVPDRSYTFTLDQLLGQDSPKAKKSTRKDPEDMFEPVSEAEKTTQKLTMKPQSGNSKAMERNIQIELSAGIKESVNLGDINGFQITMRGQGNILGAVNATAKKLSIQNISAQTVKVNVNIDPKAKRITLQINGQSTPILATDVLPAGINIGGKTKMGSGYGALAEFSFQ